MSGMHRPVSSRGYGGGQRPGTGQMTPSGSAMRPGSGRLGTGQQEVNYGGVGLNTNVNIADRPVTQQGMAGLRTASAGKGRQVQDVSYYLGLLRTKMGELQTEIQRLHSEAERRKKEETQQQQLERKYENLVKEVRNLEGELADYNLAMDKLRTNVNPNEVNSYLETLKQRNQEDAREIDGIFMERQEREKGIQRLESQIEELRKHADEKLNSLPSEKLSSYHRYVEQNKQSRKKLGELQEELEHLNSQIDDSERKLQGDTNREEYARLMRRYESFKRDEQSLQRELEATKMDPKKARERLLEKVREDTEAIKDLDSELSKLKENIESKRKISQELTQDIESRKVDAGDSQKYETLYKRDQEMTEFIDRFPEMRDKELSEQSKTKETVVALLEHISNGINREVNMPDVNEAQEMGEDLREKEKELGHSKTTQQRLEDELQKRQEELEKINSLDEKITQELSNLKEKMEIMKDSMGKFEDLDNLKEQHEAITEGLEDKRAEYTTRRDRLRQQVHELQKEYERVSSQLEANTTARALENQEKKLKHYEQSIYSLKEYIASKGKDSEYQSVKEEVLALTRQVNQQIQEAQARVTPSISAAPY